MKITFQIILGLALLVAMFFVLNPGQTIGVMSRATPAALFILFSLQLMTLAAGAWIWHFLLSRGSRVSLTRVMVINQAAGLVESLTPSVKFGGEAAKIYLFRKISGRNYHDLTGMLMVQKFITMLPFALLCLFLLIPGLYYSDIGWSYALALIFVLVMSAGLGWFCYGEKTSSLGLNHGLDRIQNCLPGRASRFLEKWISKAGLFLGQARKSAAGLLSPGQTWGLLLVSLAIWILYPLKVYLVCFFLNIEVSPLVIGLATLFAYMISMAPLLPGGLGTYEGGMTMFFTLGGLSPAEGLAISLVSRLTTFWFPLALSLLCAVFVLRGMPFYGDEGEKRSDPEVSRDQCPAGRH